MSGIVVDSFGVAYGLDVGKIARPPQKSNDLIGNNRPGNLDRVDVGKINKTIHSTQFLASNRLDRVDVGKIPFGFGVPPSLENTIAFRHLGMLLTSVAPVVTVLLSPAASAQELLLTVQRVLLDMGLVRPAIALSLALRFGTESLGTDADGCIFHRTVAADVGQKRLTTRAALSLSSHGSAPPP